MEDEMEYFIDQIGQIYNETYGNGEDKHQYGYFISGGCYILSKIVKHYCPSVKIMHCIKDYNYYPNEGVISRIKNYFQNNKNFIFSMKKFDHATIKYNDKLYDILGKVPINYYDNYVESTDNDIMAMENGFSTGEGLGESKVYNKLINEIDHCGFEKLIDAINEETIEKAKSL
jgi:hypothetical protein